MWKTVRNLFVVHWQLKLTAIFIAVAVWFYGTSRLKEEVVLQLPVNIEVPDGYRLLYQSHRHAQLRFSGPQYLIQRRQEEARQNFLMFHLRLSGEEITGEAMTLEISPRWLNISDSELALMNVEVVTPERITFFASRIAGRNIPVEASFSGHPRAGYRITDYMVTPSEVSLVGPLAALEQLQSVRTHSIPVWDAQESFRRYVPLVSEQVIELAGRIRVPVSFETSPSQVAVHMSVGVEHREERLENLPVRILVPRGFPYLAEISAEDARIDLILSGMPHVVEGVSAEDMSAYVDLGNLEDEEIPAGESAPYKQPVSIIMHTAAEVRVVRTIPESVTVRLTNK